MNEELPLPDGRHLFEAGLAFGESALRDLQTERVTTTFAMIQAQCAAWVPGGRGILVASWEDGHYSAAQLLDRDDLRIRRTYRTYVEGMLGRVAVSGDWATIVAAQACFSVETGAESNDVAFLFDVDAGVILRSFDAPTTIHDVAFTPDERHGAEFYTSIGRLGGTTTREHLGREHYERIGRMGGLRQRKRKREREGAGREEAGREEAE